MGMAASQARYLGLTARKTNIEYEGQQINQARTALANQSANLFNQMLTMSVPTAPSTTDYTTVQYSYKDGVYGETIDEMYELSDQADGYNWLVTHHHYSDIYTGIKEMLTNPQVLGPVSTPHTLAKTTADTTDVVGTTVYPGVKKALTTGLTRTSDGWGGYNYAVSGFGTNLASYVYGSGNDALDNEIDAIYAANGESVSGTPTFLYGTSTDAHGNAYFLQSELDAFANGTGTSFNAMYLSATSTTTYTVNGEATTPYTYGATPPGANDAIIDKLFDTPSTTTGAYSVYTDADGVLQVFETSELAAAAGQVGKNYTQHWMATDTEGTGYKVGNNVVYKYDSTDSTQREALRQVLSDWADEFPGCDITDDATLNNIYTYEEMGVRYFVKKGDLDECIANQNDARFLQENQVRLATYRAESLNTKIEETEQARVQVNGEGRWENIQFKDSSAVYTLTTETKTDEDAYNAAMNQYTHDMAVYDKAIQDINAKTEVIEAEDRTLELRLKQLDTEQKALQTEMEAVAKVIQKNVESTFKTFNS